jgi:hydroxyethylthiazole kinase
MTIDHGAALARMRERAPLVQNITNFVAMTTMANVLLAGGASPAMVHAKEEVEEFGRLIGALTLNIGTLTPAWVESMMLAACTANANGKPWVLDPVGAGATTYRTGVARDLAALNPAIIRGNASEILALAGESASAKGVDAGDSVSAAESAASRLALATQAVIAVTGPVDLVIAPDGRRAEIANGHPLMPRVTALGCALTGIVAAFTATTGDPFEATVSALAYYGIAGERAALSTNHPGTFYVAFLDALHALDPETINAAASVTQS